MNDEGRGYKFETLRIKSLFNTRAADKPRYSQIKKAYDFGKRKSGMQEYVEGGETFVKIQTSGGGVFISELIAEIKSVL